MHEVKEGKGSGIGADYVRCNRCSYLDRTDFQARRFVEIGKACRKCGCNQLVDDFKMVADEEWARIAGGYYDDYRQRDAPPSVGNVAEQPGSTAP